MRSSAAIIILARSIALAAAIIIFRDFSISALATCAAVQPFEFIELMRYLFAILL
jgi:hypothetical protein